MAGCAGSWPATLSANPTAEAYAAFAGGGATVVPAGQYRLDGRHVACGDASTVLDPHFNDYAASFPKFIIVRPELMAKPATPVKLWIYYHECGLVILGPTANTPDLMTHENKADCMGIQKGVREGWLTAQAMDQVCDFIRPGIADATHLAGIQRCQLMRGCYAKAVKTTR